MLKQQSRQYQQRRWMGGFVLRTARKYGHHAADLTALTASGLELVGVLAFDGGVKGLDARHIGFYVARRNEQRP